MRVLFSKMSPRKLNEDLIREDVMERAPKNIFTNSTPDPVLKSKQTQDVDEEEKN